MGKNRNQIRGVLLGLAVGDAMGHTVDSRSLVEIRADYGPNGLLGYDLVNGCAEITSYTQLAAFSANGLLLGITRTQLQGSAAKPVRYIALALKEWSRSQCYTTPERNYCWLSNIPEMKRRFCMDTRMLDALNREALGSLESPQYKSSHPGALTAAMPVALLWEDMGLSPEEAVRLGAEAVALTHGNPEAFLASAALTCLLKDILLEPTAPIGELVQKTIDAVTSLFGNAYSQTLRLTDLLQQALSLAVTPGVSAAEAMEALVCATAAEVLAGAVYAVATCGRDFDTAMIAAVNHSGRSAAVGAVAGCLLGGILGDSALPEFYLECLEPAATLTELAKDLTVGRPMVVGSSLFDIDWDRKYLRAGQ